MTTSCRNFPLSNGTVLWARVTGSAVRIESQWRQPDLSTSRVCAARSTGVVVARWQIQSHAPRQFVAPALRYYTVGVALRCSDIFFSVDGKMIHDGMISVGSAHVTAPGQTAEAVFRRPCDVLHLFFEDSFLDHCGSETIRLLSRAEARPQPCIQHDPAIAKLAFALTDATHIESSYSELYTESLSLAIVTRLLARATGGTVDTTVSRGLSRHRLNLIFEYIDAHLDHQLSLAEMSRVVGLTSMHFAAQFRLATGSRPHEYLLRRRIEYAQDMLRRSDAPLPDIALSAGFRNQSHFTAVFKRFTGDTPGRWRNMHAASVAMTPNATCV
ncbi:DNA-binding protein [Burkholderia cenocepacia]|nr:helix-turn-helix domain protein [Burkholderia cepacia]ONR54866.1 DNA-binding protein [Burkholderia cenocepacia]ONR67979.1 DNA-binding protein [Burkholderia cenocepacia]ONR71612.1 DNA-binding protein [Burkholderia cenocepacia]ONR79718.1 DNA-binding protein [Burkholderia cenocepacia]